MFKFNVFYHLGFGIAQVATEQTAQGMVNVSHVSGEGNFGVQLCVTPNTRKDYALMVFLVALKTHNVLEPLFTHVTLHRRQVIVECLHVTAKILVTFKGLLTLRTLKRAFGCVYHQLVVVQRAHTLHCLPTNVTKVLIAALVHSSYVHLEIVL